MKERALRICTCLCLLLFTVVATRIAADEPHTVRATGSAWTGSVEQKVSGLMTVWAEAKYNFPFFDRRPGLDWDAKVKEYIPKVIAAPDLDSYYKLLQELAALLKDGHTAVNPPGWPFTPGVDKPPLELQVVEGTFVVARVGDTAEIEAQRVLPGIEVLEVDGIPVRSYFEDHVLRYESRGTKQADDAIELWHILDGPKGSTTRLKVRDLDGTVRVVELRRNSATRAGRAFQWRLIEWYTAEPPVEAKRIEGGVLYFRICSFEDRRVVEEFDKVFDGADWSAVRGVVLDLRFNPGGDSDVAYAIASHFIDRPIEAGVWRSRKYVPAHRGWGYEPEWEQGTLGSAALEPRTGHRFTGPLVVLAGPSTYSSAEDFIVPLHAAGRVTLVGETTAGSTGNPLRVQLPGGGNFRVVTIDCTYPDGRPFVGIGIRPDVEVHPTRDDLANGHDRVLARAIEVIVEAGPPRAS